MDIIIPELYLLWGLGHHEPKESQWRAPSGLCLHRLHAKHTLPYARSRAILAYLATKAVELGTTFTGSLDDIAEMFELPWPIDNIRKHFLRVVHTEFECTSSACACSPFPCRGIQRVAYNVRYCELSHKFRITLSEEFVLAARFGIRCPGEQVAALLRAEQLAALDLLIWYLWQIKRGRPASGDVLGEYGPFRRIKTAEARTRKRDEIVRLHTEVLKVWPDCPFQVSADGNKLTYESADVLLESDEQGCLIDIDIDKLKPAETVALIARRAAAERLGNRYGDDDGGSDDDDGFDGHVADFHFDDDDEIQPVSRLSGRRTRKPPMTIPVRNLTRPRRTVHRLPRMGATMPTQLPEPSDLPPWKPISLPQPPRPPPLSRLQQRERAPLVTGPPERQPSKVQTRRSVVRAIRRPRARAHGLGEPDA